MKANNNISLRKNLSIAAMVIIDSVIIFVSYILAILLKYPLSTWGEYIISLLRVVPVFILIHVLLFVLLRLYYSIWRYCDMTDVLRITFVNIISSALSYILYILLFDSLANNGAYSFSLSFFALSYLIINALSVIARAFHRIVKSITSLFYIVTADNNYDDRIRVLVVGAGEAASVIVNEITHHANSKYRIMCLVDDDDNKLGMRMHGHMVMGKTDEIYKLARAYNIEEIIVAIPSATPAQLARILNLCTKSNCKVRVMPMLSEMPESHNYNLHTVRDVRIEDLLGRDSVNLDIENIAAYINGATVLVTGGGGSIGSELCRQIVNFSPKKLVIFDIYENCAYELKKELQHSPKYNNTAIDICIGSIRDMDRLEEVFQMHRPDVVFHAAAYKHVPLMESCPAEAVKNNIMGTYNTAKCADKYSVKRFVMISTDKAVNPTSVMGATKRVAELIIQAMNLVSKTEFVAVRFGNVLNSNGSVIPIFKKQIEAGGPVTVTHPDITRFFMTIPEAAQLVIQAGAMA
ncbi:MAG TPA: nucleoside-diphosphate sugar epimerase/dehydratase, partial [Clostridia bacterium]|nr:nucleoside-diphosphate sugar epimerase/dehydratase [Clostridia bacterium]